MRVLDKAARVGSPASVDYQLGHNGQYSSCCPMTALLLQEALEQENLVDLGLQPNEILAMYLES